jgi:hypothetical protein
VSKARKWISKEATRGVRDLEAFLADPGRYERAETCDRIAAAIAFEAVGSEDGPFRRGLKATARDWRDAARGFRAQEAS